MQQRRRSNGPEPWAGEVRTTAAGDDRAYPRVRLGSGPESGSRSRACTEVTDARYQIAVRGPEPASRGEEATGQKLDELRHSGLAGSPGEIVDKLGRFAGLGVERAYLQVLDLQDLDQWRAAAITTSTSRPATASIIVL